MQLVFFIGCVLSCPVLHMAGDFCFAGHVLVFLFSEHMAFVLVFRVPCAVMSVVLTPPILLPDYWLICLTRVSLVTFLICSLYNLLVFAVLCQFIIAFVLASLVSLRGSFCLFHFIINKKTILLHY